MRKKVSLIALASLVVFLPQIAYGIEISAIPEKDVFGPNDWLRILVEIDEYESGEVKWLAHRPDGTQDSGVFDRIINGKTIHSIVRNAYDEQFGTWQLEYTFQDISKTIPITVEPLLVEVTTDKQTYYSDETVFLTFTTNYFEPKPSRANLIHIEFFDKNGELVNGRDEVTVKASQNSTALEFSVYELIENNPYGKYKAVVKYFDELVETVFEITDPNKSIVVFVGTDKSVYHAGESVEVNLVTSEVLSSKVQIEVIGPHGKSKSYEAKVDRNLTRIFLNDLELSAVGTCTINIEYSGIAKSTTFQVK